MCFHKNIKMYFIYLGLLCLTGCSTTSVKNSTLVAFESSETITFSVPASKVKLIIQNRQLIKQNVNPTNSYRYFNYSGKTSKFSISGWFEPASLYKGLQYSWGSF
jgi:hypothetical protein